MVVEPKASRLVSSTISRWVNGIPDNHAPEHGRAVIVSFAADESDQVVGPDIPVLRNGTLRRYLVSGILLQTGDEIDFLGGPLAKQRVIVIAAIHHHDGAGIQREDASHLDVAASGLSDQHIARQVIVVVEQHMGFDTAFGLAESGPWKHLQAERDGG